VDIWTMILAVVVVGLLLIVATLGLAWVRAAEQLVSAQEDAHAATERADSSATEAAELRRSLVQAEKSADDWYDRAIEARASGRRAQAHVETMSWIAAMHIEEAQRCRVAARLALTFYGREHDVAVQAGEAFASQIARLEEQYATIDALRDEIAEQKAEIDAGVDERAELRERVRGLQSQVRRGAKAVAS
jgi:hypothetical protein